MNAKKECGKTIHLSQLVFGYLKQWRAVAAAMLVGAVLLGGLQLVLPARMVTDSRITTENQQKIDDNQSTIQSYYDSIGGKNETQALKERNERIKNDSQTLERQKKALSRCEETLSEVEDLMDSLSGSALMDALSTKTKLLEDMRELQNSVGECEANISYYEKDIKNVKKQFAAIKKLKAENKKLKAEMEAQPESRSIKRILGFAVLGACIGAFLVACAVLVRYWFRKTLDAASSVGERWNVPVIADVHAQPQTKHNTKLDQRIAAWSGDAQPRNTDAAYELLAAKLQAICSADEIILCGSIPAEKIEQLAQRLRKNLTAGRTILAVGNPAEDAQAAKILKGREAVMVEKIDSSRYAEMNALLEQANLEQTHIIGCIVV